MSSSVCRHYFLVVSEKPLPRRKLYSLQHTAVSTAHSGNAGAPGRCSRSPCCTKFAGHSGFCSGPRALNDVAGAARLRQEEPEDTTDQLQRRPSGTYAFPPLTPTPQALHSMLHPSDSLTVLVWPSCQVWVHTLSFFGYERKRACSWVTAVIAS